MIMVTSSPVTVFADEDVTEIEEGNEGEQNTPTAEEVAAEIAQIVTEAEAYTGTLREGENEASGEIGTMVQQSLDDIAKADEALNAGNTLYDIAEEVGAYVGEMSKEGTAGEPYNYSAQITDSEKDAKKAADAVGVVFDANGIVDDKSGLEKKVSDANGKIEEAEDAKKEVYDALKGDTGIEKAIKKAEGLISTASGLKSTADDDTSEAEAAIAGKDALDSATQEQLDNIADDLEKAVNEQDPEKAVSTAQQASADAAKVSSDNLKVAQKAFDEVKSAANEAKQHKSDYSIEQLTTVVGNAQKAAKGAKDAADLAAKAVTTAEAQEKSAKDALDAARSALLKAQQDAIAVLQEYKNKITAINMTITTANGSISAAQSAMNDANTAIDDAIALLSDTTPTGAQAKIKAMNDAIAKANTAIKGVTGLMYADGATREEKEKTAIGAAEKKLGDTQYKLTQQLDKLLGAKKTYDNTIAKTGEVKANREKIENDLGKIFDLIDGVNNNYEKWAEEVDNLNSTSEAKEKIIDAQQKARSYLNQANISLGNFHASLLNAKDGVAKYEEVKDQINKEQKRLDKVAGQLKTLKDLQKHYASLLSTTSEDADLMLGNDDTIVDLLALNKKLNEELAALKKFDPSKYNQIALVSPELMEMNAEDISISLLSDKLAAAINTASQMVETQQGNIKTLEDKKADLVSRASAIRTIAEKAQKQADLAASYLKSEKAAREKAEKEAKEKAEREAKEKAEREAREKAERDRRNSEDRDDDNGSESGSESGSYSYTVPGTGTVVSDSAITVGRPAATRGVLGVKSPKASDDANKKVSDDKKDTDKPAASDTKADKPDEVKKVADTTPVVVDTGAVKIADPERPLAAAPGEESNPMRLALLIGAFGTACAGVFGYGSYKKKASAADESKKYKKQ